MAREVKRKTFFQEGGRNQLGQIFLKNLKKIGARVERGKSSGFDNMKVIKEDDKSRFRTR